MLITIVESDVCSVQNGLFNPLQAFVTWPGLHYVKNMFDDGPPVLIFGQERYAHQVRHDIPDIVRCDVISHQSGEHRLQCKKNILALIFKHFDAYQPFVVSLGVVSKGRIQQHHEADVKVKVENSNFQRLQKVIQYALRDYFKSVQRCSVFERVSLKKSRL